MGAESSQVPSLEKREPLSLSLPPPNLEGEREKNKKLENEVFKRQDIALEYRQSYTDTS